MKIIFAQGNPGDKFTYTRHNVGFLLIDMLAKKWGIDFTQKPKFHAAIAETSIQGEKVFIVKPTTFYNETGISARALIDFYKINPAIDFIVIHDDLALPFGVLRTRASGSDAGNNGIKSLNTHLGEDYNRIRVGMYHELRDQVNDVDFVLGTLNKKEQDNLPQLFDEVETFINQFLSENLTLTKVTIFR